MLHLLPDELVMEVAASIQDNKSLISLALTHRSFGTIVYERLIRSATIPFRSIPKYIMLLARHQQWANVVTEIELQDNKSDMDDFSCTPRELSVIKDVISKLPKGPVKENARYMFKTNPQNPQLWTALLLNAVPNAHTLQCVSIRAYEETNVYRSLLWQGASEGFWKRSLPLLRYSHSRIQILTVRAPSETHKSNVILRFTNLRTLVVDGKCLRSANYLRCDNYGRVFLEQPHPIRSLLENLETIHVYGNERTMPWQWLFELQQYQRSRTFVESSIVRLTVRLYFNMPCRILARFLIYHFEPESYQMISVIELLRSWKQSNIDVQAYFRDSVDSRDAFDCPGLFTCGDLLEEVLAAERKAELDPWWRDQPGKERKGTDWRRYLEREYLQGRPVRLERRHSL